MNAASPARRHLGNPYNIVPGRIVLACRLSPRKVIMKFAICLVLLVLSIATVALSSTARAAEAYPARRVTVVVPLPSGGPVDLMSRVIANALQERLKQPVIVENRVGAGGLCRFGIGGACGA